MEDLGEYERLRQENILRNNSFLAGLGLVKPVREKRKVKRKVYEEYEEDELEPRRSKRVRGIDAADAYGKRRSHRLTGSSGTLMALKWPRRAGRPQKAAPAKGSRPAEKASRARPAPAKGSIPAENASRARQAPAKGSRPAEKAARARPAPPARPSPSGKEPARQKAAPRATAAAGAAPSLIEALREMLERRERREKQRRGSAPSTTGGSIARSLQTLLLKRRARAQKGGA